MKIYFRHLSKYSNPYLKNLMHAINVLSYGNTQHIGVKEKWLKQPTLHISIIRIAWFSRRIIKINTPCVKQPLHMLSELLLGFKHITNVLCVLSNAQKYVYIKVQPKDLPLLTLGSIYGVCFNVNIAYHHFVKCAVRDSRAFKDNQVCRVFLSFGNTQYIRVKEKWVAKTTCGCG